jgi:hypothetical protein
VLQSELLLAQSSCRLAISGCAGGGVSGCSRGGGGGGGGGERLFEHILVGLGGAVAVVV